VTHVAPRIVVSDTRVRRVIVEHIVAPPALAFAKLPELRDELNAVDPLGHLVPELMLDSESQRRTVLDWKRRAVHLIGEDYLGFTCRLEIDDLVIVAIARAFPFLIERVEHEISGVTRRPCLL
jgi:hypothetical protein